MDTLLAILIVIGMLVVGFLVVRWVWRLLLRAGRPRRGVQLTYTLRTSAAADYPIEVVGESHYQDALATIAGGRDEEGVELEMPAELVPEADNPFDDNAVAVMIRGRKVGHLARDEAKVYRKKIGRKPLACAALITGGWDRGEGDRGHFGVRLRIAG